MQRLQGDDIAIKNSVSPDTKGGWFTAPCRQNEKTQSGFMWEMSDWQILQRIKPQSRDKQTQKILM